MEASRFGLARLYRVAFAAGLLVLAASWVLGAWFAVRTSGHLPGLDLHPLSTARALDLSGDDFEALREYRVLWRIDPTNADALEGLVGLLSRSGSNDAAIRTARQGLAQRPLDPRRHLTLAAALVAGSGFEEAMKHLELALRLGPGYAPTHVGLGDYWWARGDTKQAVEAYGRALALDPRNADAHNKLGVSLAVLGNPAEAVGHFEAALRAEPDSPVIAANLARARAAAAGSSP